MQKILTCLILMGTIFASNNTQAQCLIEDVSIENRIQKSQLIIDGEVVSASSFWKDGNIYTKNKIKVYQVFKGNVPSGDIEVITLGGAVGNAILKVEPSLDLKQNEAGMFMLEAWLADKQYYLPVYDAMGFIAYDRTSRVAQDLFHQYGAIKNQFLPWFNAKLKAENTEANITLINTPFYSIPIFGTRATPVISSIVPQNMSAGTDSTITITGNNFGANRGPRSKVDFKNGNDGGASWEETSEYVGWSNTSIVVVVPTLAGTGTIRVTKDTNEFQESAQILTVPYSHINAGTPPNYTQHVEDNGNNNDIIWTFNKRFFDSSDAKDAFLRSLENWRCATLMPWNAELNKTTVDQAVGDNINIITWDFNDLLPINVLGRTYSRFFSCPKIGGGSNIFVDELDIIFNNKFKWHYALANAPGGQYDFVSVATHELGHGHQLSHVIDATKMMHYSIGAGQTKRTITAEDINGGNAVHARSVKSVCFKNPLVLLNSNNCNIINTQPEFNVNNTTPCLLENIVFTDNTSGGVLTWSWNFGAGASPGTGVGIGPHTVKYTSGGSKDVTLTTTTLGGPKVVTKNNFINVNTDPEIKAAVNKANSGNNIFRFYSVNGSTYTNDWLYNSDADTIKDADTIFITFPQPGNYVLKLHAYNNCDDTTIIINMTDWTNTYQLNKAVVNIYPNPAKDILHIENADNSHIEQWMISDLSGKLIETAPYNNLGLLDIGFLQSGMYLIHLKVNGQYMTTKLIKE